MNFPVGSLAEESGVLQPRERRYKTAPGTFTTWRQGLLGGWWKISGLVFRQVHFLPVTAHDGFADLRGCFTFAGLFVREESLFLANLASGTVMADEAIQ